MSAGAVRPVDEAGEIAGWQTRLQQIKTQPEAELGALRRALARAGAHLEAAFDAGAAIETLVHARSALIDAVLLRVWRARLAAPDCCLVAVGGYGRGELLPRSDIDLLVVYRDGQLDTLAPAVESFITALWDLDLAIGHSVRTPRECGDAAAADITVATNLMEARALAGDADLFAAALRRAGPTQIWPSAAFFQAKAEEQKARHARFDETAYKLEPNLKESPGGLRDIQMIAWVARRHFASETLDDLVERGFLSRRELAELKRGRDFLWRVRFLLHALTDRAEDRLLFDYQIAVAERLGYRDRADNLAVEQFMQRYYRTIKALSALNDILLQLFDEAILKRDETAAPRALNANFQARHGYVEVVDDAVFRRQPSALLEIFYVLQTRPRLYGIRAHTLRLIRRDRHLIDAQLRSALRCRLLFTEILGQRSGVTRALRRMNRYGVLGRYLPNFGRIIGRMQYDLFHTLTVDEHTLFVVRNLRRLALPRFDYELPFASSLMQSLDKPQILLVAALMHDIAKGRGGDHAELGAEDARAFCRDHGLSSADTELVCWLVRQHLLMSMTAQRRDINDVAVVNEFARAVASRARLDRLFVLTVCDIRATNPDLWNGWRETLLTQLYGNARRALERGLDTPLSEDELIGETRSAAAALATRYKVNTPAFKQLWARLDRDYFLRHTPEEVARQTHAIVNHRDDRPLVSIERIRDHGTLVFVYCRDRDYLFGVCTGVLARAGLSVLDARVNSTVDGYTLDTYVVSESDGSAIDEHRPAEIRRALVAAIENPSVQHIDVKRRASRRSRQFDVPTQVYFTRVPGRDATVMEVMTADVPGLLSQIGDVFRRCGVLVQTAKIATIGERAEDVFFITDRGHRAVADPAALRQLRERLTHELDPDNGA